MSIHTSTPMVRTLMNAIARMDSAGRVKESLALAYWPRVAGPRAAAATRPESIRDGNLFICTRSSAWSHELNLHKARLIQGLNRILGGPVVREIYFRAHGVDEQEEPKPEREPSAEELSTVLLEPGEKEELRRALCALYERVPDDAIRARIARRMSHEARLRHWRLERGWRLCVECGCTYNEPGAVCPMCGLKP